MDVVLLIGRVLFVVLFISSGIGHFKPEMVGYAKSLGAPSPERLVPLTGVVIIAGGVSVALGIFGDIGALLLLGFLCGITPIMHGFWKLSDPMERGMQQVQFMKNLSLAGGAIIIFWLFNQGQDLPLTITDSLLKPW